MLYNPTDLPTQIPSADPSNVPSSLPTPSSSPTSPPSSSPSDVPSAGPTRGAWLQLGDDIDGEAANDQSGGSVAFSSDGNTLAVGAPFKYGAGNNAGQVRIFAWIDGA